MSVSESKLRSIIREEIKQTLNEAGGPSVASWNEVDYMLDNREGIFMSRHRDDYITVSLGRASLDIPVDKSRDAYYS